MKIIFTEQEMMQAKRIMNTVENNSFSDICVDIKKSPLIKACYIADTGYEVDVDAAYMADFLGAASESAGVIVPMLKGAYAAAKMMFQKLERIAMHHTTTHNNKRIALARENGKVAAENVSSLLYRIAQEASARTFGELDPLLQQTLLLTYGNGVIDMFNTIVLTSN